MARRAVIARKRVKRDDVSTTSSPVLLSCAAAGVVSERTRRERLGAVNTTMKYLAAYLLLKLGGAEEVTAEDVRKVVSASGAEVDDERVTALLDAVNGRSVEDLVTEGRSKMESVAGVAVAAAAAPAGAAAAAGGDKAAATEAAKGAAKEEPKEESDEDLGFGLFD